jgi:hypothetical protein
MGDSSGDWLLEPCKKNQEFIFKKIFFKINELNIYLVLL